MSNAAAWIRLADVGVYSLSTASGWPSDERLQPKAPNAPGILEPMAIMQLQGWKFCHAAAGAPLDTVRPSTFHLLKCSKSPPTPVSQAVAVLLSMDTISIEKAHRSMELLSRDLSSSLHKYSTTEIAAFCEVCRKLGFVNHGLFLELAGHLETKLQNVHPEDLGSLVWALSRLSPVEPRIRNVCGTAVLNTVDSLSHSDLPIVLQALADMEYRDPFVLASCQEAVERQLEDFTAEELRETVGAFATMADWYFDLRLFKRLVAFIHSNRETYNDDAISYFEQIFKGLNIGQPSWRAQAPVDTGSS